MLAVVEHDVGGPACVLVPVNLLDQFCGDVVGGWVDPIAGHGVPCDRRHAEMASGAEYEGTTRAVGGAEVAHRLAEDLLEYRARAREFFADLNGRGAREIGVAPGMIADEVASVGDAACEALLGFSVAADHEKGGVHVVRGEDVEEARGPCGVGAVVESEGHLAGAGRSNERTAEYLRGGPNGCVGKGAEGEAHRSDRAQAGINARC